MSNKICSAHFWNRPNRWKYSLVIYCFDVLSIIISIKLYNSDLLIPMFKYCRIQLLLKICELISHGYLLIHDLIVI